VEQFVPLPRLLDERGRIHRVEQLVETRFFQIDRVNAREKSDRTRMRASAAPRGQRFGADDARAERFAVDAICMTESVAGSRVRAAVNTAYTSGFSGTRGFRKRENASARPEPRSGQYRGDPDVAERLSTAHRANAASARRRSAGRIRESPAIGLLAGAAGQSLRQKAARLEPGDHDDRNAAASLALNSEASKRSEATAA
jgi:hypothetical protein